MNQLDYSSASREVLWNVSAPANSVVMYILFLFSMVVFLWGLWRRVRIWSAGARDSSRLANLTTRSFHFVQNALLQRKVNRERTAKIFHTLIFWGFLVLLFTTTMVFIDHDLGIKIYRGEFYLAVTLLSDLFGLGLFVGISYAYYLRYITKPDKLHSSNGDFLMLGLLGLLVIQGFGLEAMRIRATGDIWASYSPVGYILSLGLWTLSVPSIKLMHWLLWWFHTVTVFSFIALLPYTKFLHIFTSSANLFFSNTGRPKGAQKYPGDIEHLMAEALGENGEGEFKIGVTSIGDLTWKQRLDLDACTSCGRCQEVCPAYNSGKALSPKWLILDSRNHMLSLAANSDSEYQFSLFNRLDQLDSKLVNSFTLANIDSIERSANPLVQKSAKSIGQSESAKLSGEVLDEDVFWSCTTCRACMEVCPVGIEHVDLIMDARRSMALLDGNLPSEAQSSLRAIETRGNPFGPAESRAHWTQGLKVNVVEPGAELDVLYWVGCISAFDKRKQKIAISMVNILNASGLNWGILGNKERCTGDPARRLGEENLFQNSAKQNIELLQSIKFSTLVANCPHCFNTLKNEYPDIGDIGAGKNYRVIHHTQLIDELISKKKLKLKDQTLESITFHDPCYLGRYNETYSEPREILVQLGTSSLKEMKDSKEKAMCCGAGGGHYWFDMKVGQRVNTIRVEQAAQTGASCIATGCPFCLQMMEDGVKITDSESQLKVRDIAELVAENLAS